MFSGHRNKFRQYFTFLILEKPKTNVNTPENISFLNDTTRMIQPLSRMMQPKYRIIQPVENNNVRQNNTTSGGIIQSSKS